MEKLDDLFWSEKYASQNTGWDIGFASGPLVQYINQLTGKTVSILIPGCGNAYEAEYLLKEGFGNVTLLDISHVLVAQLQEKFDDRPIRVMLGDFFDHEGHYDLILEQTFFCALNPRLRKAYAEKMWELLKPGGKLVGILFNRAFEGGPPFGGSKEEYQRLFEKKFSIKTLEPCYNSIIPREDAEVFINLVKNA